LVRSVGGGAAGACADTGTAQRTNAQQIKIQPGMCIGLSSHELSVS
jgi:hypothetical protein